MNPKKPTIFEPDLLCAAYLLSLIFLKPTTLGFFLNRLARASVDEPDPLICSSPFLPFSVNPLNSQNPNATLRHRASKADVFFNGVIYKTYLIYKNI